MVAGEALLVIISSDLGKTTIGHNDVLIQFDSRIEVGIGDVDD